MATPPKYPPARQRMTTPDGLVDRNWLLFFEGLVNQAAAAGSGSVTHTGSLIANELIVGNGVADIKPLGSFGSAGQILVSQGTGNVPAFTTLTPLPSGFSSALDGDDGRDGFPGIPGAAGAAGPAGATGAAGSGFPGIDGDDGLDGWPGPPGIAGATGPQGAAGVSVQNLIGTDGDDGDPGFPGAPGVPGVAGATGSQGPAGTSVPSLMGFDGDDGVDGLPGPAGATGGAGSGTLGVPIVVDTNTTLAADQGMVVPESLEVASGVIFEIAGGARVEVTGPAIPINTPTIRRKPSNQTVNNSGAFINDNDLFFSVLINSVWLVELSLLLQADSTASDFTFQWSLPAGSTLNWGPNTVGSTLQWDPVLSGTTPTALSTTVSSIGSAASGVTGCFFRAIIAISTTAGNIQLQWAQLAATVGNNTLLKNSALVAHQLA